MNVPGRSQKKEDPSQPSMVFTPPSVPPLSGDGNLQRGGARKGGARQGGARRGQNQLAFGVIVLGFAIAKKFSGAAAPEILVEEISIGRCPRNKISKQK